MNEIRTPNAWVFVCFIQSERKFIAHSLSINSFAQALQMHSQTFPSHSVVFCFKCPIYMTSVVVKTFQNCLLDSDKVFSQFVNLLNVDNNLMPITPVKTYQGLVPLSYSTNENRLLLSMWNNERYIDAVGFILSIKLLPLFNEYLYSCSQNEILKLFQNGI